ncbi:MAG: ADP-ribosylglycohydrolase family protein [archaeon]
MNSLLPAQRMLLGIAIGDAFGAGYEFAKQTIDFTKYTPHPKFNQKPGMYTDDTQMSIAVAELLLNEEQPTKEHFAKYFFTCFKRNPIKGYSKGFQKILEEANSPEAMLKAIMPKSERNGAAMRSVPLGLMDFSLLIPYATANASVTHNTPKGIASSTIIALLAHYQYHEEQIPRPDDIIPYIKDRATRKFLKESWDKPDMHKDVPADGMRTAGAVYHLLRTYRNPMDVLKAAVYLGGDVDTVASISLGISLMHKPIPDDLYKGLINHTYGRDYLVELGKKLGAKYPSAHGR